MPKKSNKSTSKKTAKRTTRKTKKRVVKAAPVKKTRFSLKFNLAFLKALNKINWNFAAALINLLILFTLFFFYKEVLLKPQLPIIIPAYQQVEQVNPVFIDIPKTAERIPVESAHIINGNWQTSDNTATHLITSSGINGGGNIVIYGHNTSGIFKSLKTIAVGESLILEATDQSKHEYKISEIKVVDPEQVTDVQPADHEVLTVYTCTGWLDSKRLIIKAYPISSSN